MLSALSRKVYSPIGLVKVIAVGVLAAIFLTGMLLLTSTKVYAAENPISVTIDTKDLKLDIEPDIGQGTTLVQMRPVFEALGMELKWDSATKHISAQKEGLSLSMTLGNNYAIVNGERIQLSRPAEAINGHTVVPLRFIGEATGAIVHWNPHGPEILVLTDEFIATTGMTKEEMKDYVAQLQKDIDKEAEEQKKKDDPAPPKKTVELDKVDTSKLKGTLYGFEPDMSGYECGGMCWRFYTFLPDNKIVVGEPAGGGPESIDCKVDRCQSYTIKNGKELVINGGKTLPIGTNSKGAIVINGAIMSPVTPASDGLKLNEKYITQGYSGLVGITPAATSWKKTITFASDGTFETDNLSIGVLNTGSGHSSGSTADTLKGTYTIKGNTMTLKYSDGTVKNLIFVPEDKENGKYSSIQIGSENYDLVD